MPRAPHFLRVTQALALVSGIAPVAFAVATAMPGCGSTITCAGFCGAPDGPYDATSPPGSTGGNVPPLVPFDGGIQGATDAPDNPSPEGPDASDAGEDASDVAAADAMAEANADAGAEEGGSDAAVDGGADALAGGGPLPPPELPA